MGMGGKGGARGSGALARAGRGGAAVHAALWPRGPSPAPPAPPAAGLSRCHVRPQRRGAVRARVRARPAGLSGLSEPSAAAAAAFPRRGLAALRAARRRLCAPQRRPSSRGRSALALSPARSLGAGSLRQVRRGRCR